MPATVLGIAGSPRKDGNTDALLHEVLRGAQEAGAGVEFLALRGLKMHPCIECDRCQTTGRCVVRDDALAVHDKLLAADHLVFATPIFFAAVSAQAKILIDRCQCFWSLKYIMKKPLFDPPRPHRKGLWLACCGFDRRWMFDGPRRTMKALFNVLELAWGGELCYKHIDAQGDILNHPSALADAYQAGRALALGEPVTSTP
ncbi:MAG TPA: flavodoxin family protein [Planctomycetota bacterium]|nr:flavodoxin family protein [Planctomycetota bacterium]